MNQLISYKINESNHKTESHSYVYTPLEESSPSRLRERVRQVDGDNGVRRMDRWRYLSKLLPN